MVREVDLLVIGAGPAGLGAAVTAASMGAEVLLVDRQNSLGGQLIKQTHMFFGSKEEYASIRGIDIATILAEQVEESEGVETLLKTTALAYYPDGVVTLEKEDSGGEEYLRIKPSSIIMATGASEKSLAFPGLDLPGIYGAGAVQTLMNVYGVLPGKRVIMVGAGNIGLIVSYQLIQAGVEVLAVVEAAPAIGGYTVHASKIARLGVSILTSHTIKEAFGEEELEEVSIVELDASWREIPGSEHRLKADTLCLAVGLTPLTEILYQAGCRIDYIPQLGGYVAWRKANLETSVPGVFVAGDMAGIEEASSAMVEGRIAGYHAARFLGYRGGPSIEDLERQLEKLRSGPKGAPIREGLSLLESRGGEGCA